MKMHQNYSRLVSLAAESHSRGRDPFLANERDIALARLYSYAFRRHVIVVIQGQFGSLEES